MGIDDELFRRQRLLQREAEAVVEDLDLAAGLEAVGDPIRTGSSALGVMVKPDIDVTTACTSLDLAAFDAVAHLATRLARHERVRQVTFRNDTGAWNTEPDKYPDGLFLQVRYRSAGPAPATGAWTCGSSTSPSGSPTWRTCERCCRASPTRRAQPSCGSRRSGPRAPNTAVRSMGR